MEQNDSIDYKLLYKKIAYCMRYLRHIKKNCDDLYFHLDGVISDLMDNIDKNE